MSKRVVIYHPSKYLGGSEVLFARVAILLQDELNCEVVLVDYNSGGTLKKALGNRCGDFIFLDCANKNFYEKIDGSVLLASARNIVRFYAECPNSFRNIEFRPVFWLLHPEELYAQIAVGYNRVKKVFGYEILRFFYKINPFRFCFEKTLKKLLEVDAIYFMDQAVFSESEWIMSNKIPDPKYLRLISGLDKLDCALSLDSDVEKSKFVLISRLDSFKLPGIYKLLIDLTLLYKNNSWFGNITIIGSGDGLQELKNFSLDLPFEVNFAGYVPSSDLRSFLVSGRYGLFFGMGMSLLEGASIGLPCIMLPASEKNITEDKCYATLGCDIDILGEYLNSPARCQNYKNLSDLISSISDDWSKYSNSSLCFFKNFYDKQVGLTSLNNIVYGGGNKIKPERNFVIIFRVLEFVRHKGKTIEKILNRI